MKTAKLNDDEVIQKARWIWENGFTQKSGHFEAELRNADASMVDVGNMLSGQCRVKKAEWNERYRKWRYKISGHDDDGCELGIVVSFDLRNSRLILITAF